MEENTNSAKVWGSIAKRAKDDFKEQTSIKVVIDISLLPSNKTMEIEDKK